MNNFRRRLLSSTSLSGSVSGSEAKDLSVLFANNSTEKLVIIENQEDWPNASEYTPIGIVVVPGPHNRYGDGTCGIMSLVGMNTDTPETGISVTGASQTDDVTMFWGHDDANVSNSIFLSTRALTDTTNDIPYQSARGSTACTAESGALVWPYGGTITAPTSDASTAYTNADGYVTATFGKSGCDFNGIRNTAACYVKTRTAAQWTTSTVTDHFRTVNTPAAACAGRFKTVGTKSFLDVYTGITSNSLNYGTSASTKDNTGFWYLPAEGELCYIPSKRFEINKTILALNQKYGNVGVQLNTRELYWSSSECTDGDAWGVHMNCGLVTYDGKYSSRYVRAFLRL